MQSFGIGVFFELVNLICWLYSEQISIVFVQHLKPAALSG